jgi:hypothetical protein
MKSSRSTDRVERRSRGRAINACAAAVAMSCAGVATSAAAASCESLTALSLTATLYHETLHPRAGEHKIVITASGELEDGGSFFFHVTHVADRIVAIQIEL